MSYIPVAMSHIITNCTSEPFSNPHVRRIIDRIIRVCHVNNNYLTIVACDPFARDSFTTKTDYFITNDLDEMYNTTYHLEFRDFAELIYEQGQKFDLVLFDPPYSLRQLKDCYNGIGKDLPHWQTQNPWGEGKDILSKCVKPGGYVISLGWNSAGFGKYRGFAKKEVHVLQMSGREERHDLIITVERKVQTALDWLSGETEEE